MTQEKRRVDTKATNPAKVSVFTTVNAMNLPL